MPSFDLLPAFQQERDFRFSTHQRCESSWLSHIKATGGTARSKHTKTRAYSPMRIVFMGLGIAKVDEQSIPQELGDMPIVASNHLRTSGLIRTDHVPILLWV